jgi:hypothetical protein
VQAELNIHFEDHVSTKKYNNSFTNPPSTTQLQLLHLWLLKTMLKAEKDCVMIIIPGNLMFGNM